MYLDVWQREVTFLEDLQYSIEKAVGVDTTTRLQTDLASQNSCQCRLGRELRFAARSVEQFNRPVATVGLATPPSACRPTPDPRLLPPSGGYRGLENRLYRVEIHDGGPNGTATFKWSRDNASVATSVTAITALDKLTSGQRSDAIR